MSSGDQSKPIYVTIRLRSIYHRLSFLSIGQEPEQKPTISLATARKTVYNKREEVSGMARAGEASDTAKEKILDAASGLFAQYGVNGVSIRKIAAEAGINHALIIRYFGSKDQLVTAILRRELSALKNTYSVIPEQPSNPFKNLRGLLLTFLKENEDLVKLIVRSELDGLSPESYIDQSTQRIATLLANWIESQQTDKSLPNAKIVSVVVISTLISLISVAPWLVTSIGFSPKDIDKKTEEIIDVLLWMIAQAIGLPAGVSQPDQTAKAPGTEN